MSIELVMLSNHLILCRPLLLCLQSFPASGSFPRSQFFASGGQSIRVSSSTSVLSMNTQDWSPLGWTGWISSQSERLSRVFSNTTVQKHQFFSAQLSLESNRKLWIGHRAVMKRRTEGRGEEVSTQSCPKDLQNPYLFERLVLSWDLQSLQTRNQGWNGGRGWQGQKDRKVWKHKIPEGDRKTRKVGSKAPSKASSILKLN